MSHYTHFTTEERELSRVMKAQGFSDRAIARSLKRSNSSVSREFARNSREDGTYSANHADKLYAERRKNCGRKPVLEDEQAKNYVTERLEQRWTPEQIAGRAKLEKQPFSISYPTIYRAIDSGVLPKQLKKIMRFKCKRKKCKGEDSRGKIPDTVSIHERPAGAENRSRYGHWESDTVLGKRGTGCIATHVERKSGYLVAVKIPDRQDKAFTIATIAAFAKISEKLKKSFTVDNGKEFAAHKELAAGTGMKVFFCDPYSPWQRGTNENTNGLLRQFFPKGTSFDDFSDEQLQAVVDLINNRPRKRLGFRSPAELLLNFL
jgi:IS30 family transposase